MSLREERSLKRRRLLESLAFGRFKYQSLARNSRNEFWPPLDLCLLPDGKVQTGLSVPHGGWLLLATGELLVNFHYSGQGKAKGHRFRLVEETKGWICCNADVGWEAVLLPIE